MTSDSPRPKSPLLAVAIVAAIAVVLSALAAIARADVDRNIYRSSTVGIELVFPADWAVSGATSFPYLLASAIDRTLGGRMTLSLEHLHDGEKLREATERNRTTLKKVGFKVQQQALSPHPTGALVFEAITPDGKGAVRQAYRQFEDGGPIFVLTLAAPRENMQRYRRAFDDSLRGLTRTQVVVPRPATPPPATTPPAATDPSGVPSE
jgi:hypothetical protein